MHELINELPSVDVSRMTLSVEKLRVAVFLYIPGDASELEAISWLSSQLKGLSVEDRVMALHLHLHDIVVAGWRSEHSV